MSRKWSRLLKIGLPVLLVAGLVTGLTTTVLAAPKNHQNPPATANMPGKVITGAVTTITPGVSFVVQSGNQTLTTVSVNATTKFFQVPRALPARLPAVLGKFFKGNAQGDENGNGRNKQGTIRGKSNKDDNEDSEGQPETLPSGDLKELTKLGKTATFADLAVGDKVVVRLFAGTSIAQQVMIIKPLPPKQLTVTGNITALSPTPGALTITQTGTGTVFPLTWDANTRFVLKGVLQVTVNQKVTVVYNPTTKVALIVRVPVP